MDSSELAVWQRIEAFPLDDPGAPLPFSRRLAREHGWSLDFTHRAIREYRRFVFLACAAGHPVSPSEVVDAVWHEHLIYTRSYWEEFCGRVLGQPLHHEPTRGGAAEGEKFRDWYARTLASYERLFGELPPRDFWPAEAPGSNQRPALARVFDFFRLLARAQPRHATLAIRVVALLALGTGLAGCVHLFADLGPLDLPGGAFLKLYAVLAVAAFGAACFIRRRAREVAPALPEKLQEMDGYSIALLRGRDVAANAAIAQLVEFGDVRIDPSARKVKAHGQPHPNRHPLERAVHERIHAMSGVPPRDAAAFATPVMLKMEEDLRTNGLLLPEAAARRAALQSAAICGAVLIFGLIKVIIGLQRDRPVAFLVVGSVIMFVITLVFLVKKPRRTVEADALLNTLRKEHASLRGAPLRGVPAFGAAALPLAVGLFGYGVLEHTQAAELRKIIPPPEGSTSAGGCGSGCSSGGGGGSGCGGGCGGCGGGGD